jgi:hypothetical protein
LFTLAEVLKLLLLLAVPVLAEPFPVLKLASAEPEVAPWLLVLLAVSKLLLVRLAVFTLVDTTLLSESKPVLLMLPVAAAAKPVVRLRPNAVVAAARISCFFIRTSL